MQGLSWMVYPKRKTRRLVQKLRALLSNLFHEVKKKEEKKDEHLHESPAPFRNVL